MFHSAGEHMITARSSEEDGKIPKKDAAEAIREYVKLFCGEDVAKGIKDDEIFPLPEGGGEGAVAEQKSFDITFTRFLTESGQWSAGVEALNEKGGGAAAEDDAEDVANDEDSSDVSGEGSEDETAGESSEDEAADEDDEDEATEEDDEDAGTDGSGGDGAKEGDAGDKAAEGKK